MKNIKCLSLIGIIIFLLGSCQKEISFETVETIKQTLKQGQIINYQLDNIPVVENNQVLENLLKNEDDPEDEKINNILFEISIAARELIKDAKFNKIIIDMAKESPNQTANLLELENKFPYFFGVINNKLAKKGMSLSLLSSKLTYKMVDLKGEIAEEVEKYYPAIFIPNLSIADVSKQPIISPNIVVDCRNDESIEDNIIAWYYTKEGDFKEIILSEETSLKTTNPLFLLDNASPNVKKNEVEILPPVKKLTKSAQTTTTFSSYDYGIKSGYGYESWLGGKSEFSVVAYRIEPNGTIDWIYSGSGWKEIAKVATSDIGTELYKWSHHEDNWEPWATENPIPYTCNYVFWNTFERDWSRSLKSLGSVTINGVTIYLAGNMEYDHEWYTWTPSTLPVHYTRFDWLYYEWSHDYDTYKSWFSLYRVDS